MNIMFCLHYGLLFLPLFVIKAGVMFMALEDTCTINSLLVLKHLNFALVLNHPEKMFIAMHTPLL